MRLIRLPSGPLACVYAVRPQALQHSEREKTSGVFRAFSGSVEADGASEDQAIEALDDRVRRLSSPPPAEVKAFELSRDAANDVGLWVGPGIADASGHYLRYAEVDSTAAPASPRR
jgi:hypothetical protein